MVRVNLGQRWRSWRETHWILRQVCSTAPPKLLQNQWNQPTSLQSLSHQPRPRLKPSTADKAPPQPPPPARQHLLLLLLRLHHPHNCRANPRSASRPRPPPTSRPLLLSPRNCPSCESRVRPNPRPWPRVPKTDPQLHWSRLGQRSPPREHRQSTWWPHSSPSSNKHRHPTTDPCTRPCPSPRPCRHTTQSVLKRPHPIRSVVPRFLLINVTSSLSLKKKKRKKSKKGLFDFFLKLYKHPKYTLILIFFCSLFLFVAFYQLFQGCPLVKQLKQLQKKTNTHLRHIL